MTTQATKLTTAEELYAMGDIGRCELISGEIIRMAPAGAEHGEVAAQVAWLIMRFVKDRKLGKAYAAETGFTIRRNPDTTRAPDVGFVRKERVPPRGKKGFFDGAPDLAVEVISFNDLASEVREKVEEWLDAGTTSVWVIDPKTRTIQIYRQGNHVLMYRPGDQVKDDPALPGFTLKVDEVFEGD